MIDEEQTNPPAASPGTEPAAEEKITFAELGLGAEVMRALSDMGFAHAMKVQAATIPLVRERRDLMVQSRTGSGKTAAFGIPLIDWIVDPAEKFVQGIVLLPTRELALQVAAEMARIAAHKGVAVVPVYGGAPMGKQIEQLKAGGQIVCGTPGRVLDHIRRGTLKLERVRCAVLDECDEMLSMGFQEDIEAILERTPAERQTLLFSATVPPGIQRLSRRFMRDPEFVKLSADFVGVYEIRHVYYSVPGVNREGDLARVLEFENPERAIVFCNTREETGRVAEFLRKLGYDAEAISSDLSQSDRERVMGRMRAKSIRFLVATDVAARGIDLENLPCVINYTIPESPEIYIHRTGRTGRAGRQGTAISLIGPSEVGSFYYIKLLYKIKPEERSLPSETEIRSKREGERILQLRALLPAEPSAEWRALARRVTLALDGERLIAALLAERLGAEVAAPRPAAVEAVRAPEAEPARPRRSERDREESHERPREARREGRFEGRRDRERGRRFERGDRPGRAERDAPAGRGERSGRPERETPGERGERPTPPERETPGERGERPAPPERETPGERGERPTPPERETRAGRGERPTRPERPAGGAPSEGREFWEVWSEEVGRTADAPPPPAPESEAPTSPTPVPSVPAGQARLYLNLGRKDGASAEEIAALLAAEGISVLPGQIEPMNTHTYLNVEEAAADRLCSALTGKERNGRRIVCERAKPPRRR